MYILNISWSVFQLIKKFSELFRGDLRVMAPYICVTGLKLKAVKQKYEQDATMQLHAVVRFYEPRNEIKPYSNFSQIN